MQARRFFKTLALGLALIFGTTGCFTVDMLIKVRPDGSGEVELVSTVKKGFIEQFAAMAGAEGGGEGGLGDLFSETKLQETGDKLGPGVKLVRHEMIKTDTEEGVRAFYTFTDIGALRPEVMNAAPGAGGGGSDDEGGVDFSFQRGVDGAPSVITATMPQPELPEGDETAEKAAEAAPAEVDPQQMAMFSQIFAGLKLHIALEVEGKLLQSNAPRVKGNRSTLLELDFDKILESPEKLAEIIAAEPSSLEDFQKLTGDIPGLVIPTAGELRIEFQ